MTAIDPNGVFKKDSQLLAPYLKYIKEESLHASSADTDSYRLCTAKALHVLDFFMGVVIVTNLIVMIIEIDMSASNEEENVDDTTHWTHVFGWVVLIIFVLELAVRILTSGAAFWKDQWNTADFIIVATDFVVSVIGLFFDNIFPVTILRLFRFVKLARASKVLQVFPELKMLLIGLVHSVRAVFWGVLLLAMFLMLSAMMAVLIIHPLNQQIEYRGCDRCERAYSSVFQACLTFWMQIVIGDGWVQFSTPIIERYPATVFFFLPVYLTLGLAVMNLILAVVVNRSQSAYQQEQDRQDAAKAMTKIQQRDNVLGLCMQMDTDGSGELSFDELSCGLKQPGEFRDAMTALGITESDFEIAWTCLDTDKSGSVSYKEFVGFISTMMTSDTEFLLHYIKNYITWVKTTLSKQIELQEKESMKMANKLQEAIDKVEEQEEAILEDQHQILRRMGAEDLGGIAEQLELQEEQHPSDTVSSSGPGNTSPEVQQEYGSPKHGQSASHVIDVDRCQLFVHGDTDASEAVKLASVQDAVQHLAEQISSDVGKMHAELKDMIADMKRNMCQPSTQQLSDDVDRSKRRIEQCSLITKSKQASSVETYQI